MANGNGNGNGNGGSILGMWKWIAGILIAMMIAGLPGYLALLADDSPSHDDFQKVVDRQNDVLQRLAVVEERLDRADVDREDELAQINAILVELRQHEASSTK